MAEQSEYTQLPLEGLTYFWLPNGAPCFVADRDDICDQVEGLGFQIYYLIANSKTTTSQSSANNNQSKNNAVSNPYSISQPTYTYQQTKYAAGVFKVVKSIVGRAVCETDEDLGKQFVSFEDEAEYSMPPIPFRLVEKMDEFFRLIHAQHGTESIVILTYDPILGGSEGWGILVPEQTNTAAHCKYDPDSIVNLKEEHVIVVGSVHSHPEMSAYASGTDHEDQADFDGVHITFGWQKTVQNGATQYHAELQLGGQNYVLDISDVFESFAISKEPDPQVIEWSEKVKKWQAPVSGAYNTAQQWGSHGQGQHGTTPTQGKHTHGITSDGSYYNHGEYNRFTQKRQINIPDKVTSSVPFDAVIIGEVNTTETGRAMCPSCGLALFKNEVEKRGASCPSCDLPLVPMNKPIEEIFRTVNYYQEKRKRSKSLPYYLWNTNNGSTPDLHVVMCIKSRTEEALTVTTPKTIEADNGLKVATYDKEDEEETDKIKHLLSSEDNMADSSAYNFELEFWATRTWCCERDLMAAVTCDCKVMVTEEFATEFDIFAGENKLSVYKEHSDCEVCVWWYTGACPSYRQAVSEFVYNDGDQMENRSINDRQNLVEILRDKMNIDGCSKWEKYEQHDDSSVLQDMEDGFYDNVH